MTRFPLILIVALAAALIAAGCGDDDEDPTTTTTEAATGATGATGAEADVSPGRAALIEQADEICAEGDEQIDSAAQGAFGQQQPSQAEQEEFFSDVVIPNIQDQLDQLRELEPPEEDADEFNGIIDDAEAALDEAAEDPSSVAQGAGPFAEVNQDAREFGLEDCGG